MENYLRTGRPLQIEELANARNKVTLGFKCDAGTKIRLAAEAQQNGMTLSEYVDTLVQLRHQKQPGDESHKSKAIQIKLESDMEVLKGRVVAVQERLYFYEQNPILMDMFKNYQGQKVAYPDAKGKQQEIVINSISDVFTILLMSFTPKSHD